MSVVTISGGPGAPGATTTALGLLLAWPLAEGRRVVLLECDPDGGAVLSGALEGRVEAGYGLRHLAVADRRGRLAETLWEQLVDISPDGGGSRLLLPGLTDPAQAAGLAYTWEPMVTACQDLDRGGCDVLIDLGRSGAHGPSGVLARRADAVLVTVRSTLRGLSSAKPRIAALAADLDAEGTGADALAVILVQEGPYAPAEVARALGAPVLGLLPYEPRSARVLSDGGDSADRRFVRSGLMRSVRSTADEIRMLTGRRRLRLSPVPQAPRQPQPAMPGRQQAVQDPYPQAQQPEQPQPGPHQQPQFVPPAPQAPRPAPPATPQPAPLAGFAPRPPVPQAFAPPSPNGPTGPNGPGQEVARVF
ncbi:CpaE-like family protein [Streptacidiphilus sp. PAMC 29251]